MDGADAVPADQLDQLARLSVIARLRHHQACALHQRPEELPDRHVEAERGLLQNGVRFVQRIGVLHPGQAVEQRQVPVGRPLGPARGAGGVDDVG